MSPLYFFSIPLKATLLGSYWGLVRFYLPANFKKVWKNKKFLKNATFDKIFGFIYIEMWGNEIWQIWKSFTLFLYCNLK